MMTSEDLNSIKERLATAEKWQWEMADRWAKQDIQRLVEEVETAKKELSWKTLDCAAKESEIQRLQTDFQAAFETNKESIERILELQSENQRLKEELDILGNPGNYTDEKLEEIAKRYVSWGAEMLALQKVKYQRAAGRHAKEAMDVREENQRYRRALEKMGFAGSSVVGCKDCQRNMDYREEALTPKQEKSP